MNPDKLQMYSNILKGLWITILKEGMIVPDLVALMILSLVVLYGKITNFINAWLRT